MKGIILAGGSGTRLYPLTQVTSKQLLPVYDKPMIYYPLSTLMLAGIKDILIISTVEDTPRFEKLFGDGSQFGLNLSYKIQPKPNGLAQAFVIGEDFIGDDPCALILGDNIFYGGGLAKHLQMAVKNCTENGRATIFAYYANSPENFGIVELTDSGKVLSIEEKPENPKSNYAVTGLYFYPPKVSEKAKRVELSDRQEYEITSLNEMYLKDGLLDAQVLSRGYAWLDAGTIDGLTDAAEFIRMVEVRQGLKIAALEEIAYKNKWITKETLLKSAQKCGKSQYGKHLLKVAEGKMI